MISTITNHLENLRYSGAKYRNRHAVVLVSVLSFASLCVVAEERVVPQPLALTEALAFADSGAVDADGVGAADARRSQPLYLNCHSLAFSSVDIVDERRNQVINALIDPLEGQRLHILQRFFDVLLADTGFARFSEAMAVAYIRYDRTAVRAELGQYSDLRVAELDAVYQRVRHQRATSEAGQRITRSLLAQAMGIPLQLASDLVSPNLPDPPSTVPELAVVVEGATGDNVWLRGRLDGLAVAGRQLLEMELRQTALELLMRLQLLETAAAAAKAESVWRDLKLDESRTLYEMEYVADLGYSMSQQTKTRFDEERVAFCRAITRAELRALQGQPSWILSETPK